jgi:hypothetical protein
MSNAEKTIEAYQRENEKLRREILGLEVQRNKDRERIKDLEILVKSYQVQIQIGNLIPHVKHIDPAYRHNDLADEQAAINVDALIAEEQNNEANFQTNK